MACVSELSSLTWVQVIPRETGEVQLALIGKGDKERHVLIPAEIAKGLLALRGDAPPSARVFPITERRINQLIKAAAKRAKVNPEASAHWFRHAHASHAIDNGAPITLVSQTLGHAGPEDDERLCPCASEREFEQIFEDTGRCAR